MRFKAKVAIEGVPMTDGRMIDLGALSWNDEPVPVLDRWTADASADASRVLGHIEEVQRKHDGSITVRGTLNEKGMKLLGTPVSIGVTDVDYDTASYEATRLVRLKSGRLYYTQLCDEEPWPGCTLELDNDDTDMTESEFDQLMDEGEPVEIWTESDDPMVQAVIDRWASTMPPSYTASDALRAADTSSLHATNNLARLAVETVVRFQRDLRAATEES